MKLQRGVQPEGSSHRSQLPLVLGLFCFHDDGRSNRWSIVDFVVMKIRTS